MGAIGESSPVPAHKELRSGSSFEVARRKGQPYCGIGLGLRWDFIRDLLDGPTEDLAFLELSPENYMARGGFFPDALERLRDRYRMVTHGLTMSLGACDFPDEEYLMGVKHELERVASPWHSDHLCLSTAGPFVLHELLPLAFHKREARRVADRMRAVEDQLGVPMLFENISYYAHPERPEMSELDFLFEVLESSDAGLLLDVNNVYVNACNHGYDAAEFLRQIPPERIVQIHVAGHTRLPPDHIAPELLLDTHGSPVIPKVGELLQEVVARTGPVPILLERDNDVPPLQDLLAEVRSLRERYQMGIAAWEKGQS